MFEACNEADIREEVIAPLLRRLGYQSGTRNNVIREQSLRYPRASLGRKKPKTDPPLRGKADYILEVDGRVRWVIEAKPPGEAISADDVEQAWTYAYHPQVRGVYCVVCNGHRLVVFRTDHGPDCPPVYAWSFADLECRFDEVARVLGPAGLLQDFPHPEPIFGKPLGPGLRSVARILGGAFRYKESAWPSPILLELQYRITGGAIERSEAGGLVALVETWSPLRSLQEFNERLKLSRFEMTSGSDELSTTQESPTIFSYENRIVIPAGESIVSLATWEPMTFLRNVTCAVRTTARATFSAGQLTGSFTTDVQYCEDSITGTLEAMFELRIA